MERVSRISRTRFPSKRVLPRPTTRRYPPAFKMLLLNRDAVRPHRGLEMYAGRLLKLNRDNIEA